MMFTPCRDNSNGVPGCAGSGREEWDAHSSRDRVEAARVLSPAKDLVQDVERSFGSNAEPIIRPRREVGVSRNHEADGVRRRRGRGEQTAVLRGRGDVGGAAHAARRHAAPPGCARFLRAGPGRFGTVRGSADGLGATTAVGGACRANGGYGQSEDRGREASQAKNEYPHQTARYHMNIVSSETTCASDTNKVFISLSIRHAELPCDELKKISMLVEGFPP